MTSRYAEQHCGWCSRRTPVPQRRPSSPPPAPPQTHRGTLHCRTLRPERRSDKSPDSAEDTMPDALAGSLVSIWDSPVWERSVKPFAKETTQPGEAFAHRYQLTSHETWSWPPRGSFKPRLSCLRSPALLQPPPHLATLWGTILSLPSPHTLLPGATGG